MPPFRSPSCSVIVARHLTTLLFGLGCSPLAVAQCQLQGLPGSGVPGISGMVLTAARWDPDGPGPAAELLVFGGDFGIAGGTLAGSLATYDPSTGVLGSVGGASFNSTVRAVVSMPNGNLVAVGFFDYVFAGSNATFVGDVAMWNGSSWASVGTPFAGGGGQASAAVVMPNGDLVVGGNHSVRLWNGTSWSSLGGASIGRVSDLVVLPNGSLVAAWTTVQFPSGLNVSTVALWTGNGWTTLGSADGGSLRLAVLQNGELVAAGPCWNIGAGFGFFTYIARWNGTTWSALGAGVGYAPESLLPLANGDLAVGGSFTTAGGSPIAGIARWNGTSWSAIGSLGVRGSVAALQQAASGDLVACDVFLRPSASSNSFTSVAHWDGVAWSQVSSGTDDAIEALVAMPDGSVVAGGWFGRIDGVPARRIARWDGTSWSPLGTGMTAPANSVVRTLARLPNDDLVAGGSFTAVGGVAASNVARWDGGSWFPLGGGLPENVSALCTLPGGDLAAAVTPLNGSGPYDVRRWNGLAWSVLGTANQPVNALATAANGDLLATGSFTSIGGVAANRVARWNGTSWSAMGTGLDAAGDVLLLLSDGTLLVGGSFTAAGGITSFLVARWNGANWSTMNGGLGSGSVRTLLELPDGDVLAGGEFVHMDPNFSQARMLARWRGTAWYSTGVNAGGEVRSSALAGNGRIAVGGAFSQLGGLTSVYVGRIASTCPAAATVYGAGCPSSGGNNSLRCTLPWLGGVCSATASGLPAQALVVAGLGFTPIPQGALPLNTLFVQAQPGCDALVVPDTLQVLFAANGVAGMQFSVPRAATLVGVVVYAQMVPLELDALGNWLAITATNSVRLTVGSL